MHPQALALSLCLWLPYLIITPSLFCTTRHEPHEDRDPLIHTVSPELMQSLTSRKSSINMHWMSRYALNTYQVQRQPRGASDSLGTVCRSPRASSERPPDATQSLEPTLAASLCGQHHSKAQFSQSSRPSPPGPPWAHRG